MTSRFERTIACYDENSEELAERAFGRDMRELQAAFLGRVPEGGRILDAGCGPGRDSREFVHRGYVVSAIDASAEMVRLCRENTPGGKNRRSIRLPAAAPSRPRAGPRRGCGGG